MQSPVAFQRRLARPRCNVPYFEGFVPGCRDDSLAVGRPIDRPDNPTAIFLMSGNTYVMVVYASPPLTGGDTQRFARFCLQTDDGKGLGGSPMTYDVCL